MNIILIEPSDIDADGTVRLLDRRARHVREVLRVEPGAVVRVGVVRGARGTAQVVSVDAASVLLEPRWDAPASSAPDVDLIIALPRPKALSRVLQTAACMGVGRIDVVNAWRVDKSYWHSPLIGADAVRESLLLGCEQAGTTWLPEVAMHRLLMPWVRGSLPEYLAARPRSAVIAHPRTAQWLESVVRPGSRVPVIAAIGPERGWIDRELASFAALGFAEVGLGDAVLRADSAVTALLAQVALLRRLHGS